MNFHKGLHIPGPGQPLRKKLAGSRTCNSSTRDSRAAARSYAVLSGLASLSREMLWPMLCRFTQSRASMTQAFIVSPFSPRRSYIYKLSDYRESPHLGWSHSKASGRQQAVLHTPSAPPGCLVPRKRHSRVELKTHTTFRSPHSTCLYCVPVMGEIQQSRSRSWL